MPRFFEIPSLRTGISHNKWTYGQTDGWTTVKHNPSSTDGKNIIIVVSCFAMFGPTFSDRIMKIERRPCP